MMELVVMTDLKSVAKACGFESRSRQGQEEVSMYTVPMSDAAPMTRMQSELFIKFCLSEFREKAPIDRDGMSKLGIEMLPVGINVLLRRLEVMKLPIKLTMGAYVIMSVYPKVIGGTVVMLVDMLENYKDKLVGVEEIAETYPYGFYNETALVKRIEFLKGGTHAYSYVY
jgi:hypothetical protein